LAASSLAAAVLWAVPILAAGLLALLRYSFGSLFVVGESVAAALLHSTGADIAGTMQRLQDNPWRGMAHAALGLALSLGAAGLAFRRAATAMGLAAASGLWALTFGMTVPAVLLGCGLMCGIVGLMTPRP
jgi:hypothetical protein